MPESKADALKRASKGGFDPKSVKKGENGYYITPKGLTNPKAQRLYIKLRDKGYPQGMAAAIAWKLQNKNK